MEDDDFLDAMEGACDGLRAIVPGRLEVEGLSMEYAAFGGIEVKFPVR